MYSAFDEVSVARRVGALPWNRALAFGCACAHRLIWSYRCFAEETSSGDVTPLVRALDLLWDASRTGVCPPDTVCRKFVSECEAQAPNSEVHASLFTTSAQEAAFAICSLLDYCIERKVEQVLLAARYPTDSVDLYVQEVEHMSPQDPDVEARILSHPLMQQELARAHRDLTAMEIGGDEAIDGLFSRRTTEAALELEPAG